MRRWLLLLALACGDDAAELGELSEPQAAPVDCRPRRFPDCRDDFNDRACFRVPPECAWSLEAESP